MPTIVRLSRCRIEMYFDDHGLPHFHVIAGDDRASVLIESMTVIAGRVPSKALSEAITWAEEHRGLLNDAWKELNERSAP